MNSKKYKNFQELHENQAMENELNDPYESVGLGMLISSKSIYEHDEGKQPVVKLDSSNSPKATATTALVLREQPFDNLNCTPTYCDTCQCAELSGRRNQK